MVAEVLFRKSDKKVIYMTKRDIWGSKFDNTTDEKTKCHLRDLQTSIYLLKKQVNRFLVIYCRE